jgi:hypothetical protein
VSNTIEARRGEATEASATYDDDDDGDDWDDGRELQADDETVDSSLRSCLTMFPASDVP